MSVLSFHDRVRYGGHKLHPRRPRGEYLVDTGNPVTSRETKVRSRVVASPSSIKRCISASDSDKPGTAALSLSRALSSLCDMVTWVSNSDVRDVEGVLFSTLRVLKEMILFF
jgi:hypothetical protein